MEHHAAVGAGAHLPFQLQVEVAVFGITDEVGEVLGRVVAGFLQSDRAVVDCPVLAGRQSNRRRLL